MKKLLALVSVVVFLSGISLSAKQNDILISAKEAKKLIGKHNVVFASGDSEDSFPSQHIPGSVVLGAHHLHHSDITGDMACKPLYQCVDHVEHLLGSKGISNDTLVIAYDDYRGPNASGVYHFMKLYGHDKVKILNGGMAALKELGVEMEKGPEKVEHPATYSINPAKIDMSIVATKEDVLKASNAITSFVEKGGKKADADHIIIDSRGMVEIIGENKLDNVARGGHVPGATFMEWKQVTDFDNKLSYPKGQKMKIVKEKLEKMGITPDKEIYAYCHVGAGRGSYFYGLLTQLGYKNVKVYTGSWDEWGNDMNLPIRK
jgi:thiosulfate/3-mercaptopyruvate sulfurtransferase